jgi:hypothetical protein
LCRFIDDLLFFKKGDQPLRHHVLQAVDLKLKVFNCLKRTAEEVVFVKGVAKTKNLSADAGCVRRPCIKQNTLAAS